jgi:hypothetical protein
MNKFVVCECGAQLAIYMPFFDKAREILMQEQVYSKYKNYDPEKLQFCRDVQCDLSELFEALEIKKRCCRMHLCNQTIMHRTFRRF